MDSAVRANWVGRAMVLCVVCWASLDGGIAHAQPKPTSDDEDQAIAEIQAAGGIIDRYGKELLFSFQVPKDATDKSLEKVLPALKRLKSLKRVKLLDTKITDAGIAKLKGLKDLEYLSVTNTGLTDAGAKHISAMPNLTYLWVAGTKVSDAGLKHLAKLPKLELLCLSDTRMTDASIPHILSMPKLKYLYMGGTKLSQQAFTKLQEDRPELTLVML